MVRGGSALPGLPPPRLALPLLGTPSLRLYTIWRNVATGTEGRVMLACTVSVSLAEQHRASLCRFRLGSVYRYRDRMQPPEKKIFRLHDLCACAPHVLSHPGRVVKEKLSWISSCIPGLDVYTLRCQAGRRENFQRVQSSYLTR